MLTQSEQHAMFIVMAIVCILSSAFCLIIPAMYYFYGRCKGHPMNLVAIICLLEVISNYNFFLIAFNIFSFEKGTDLQDIFQSLTFHLFDIETGKTFCELNDGFFVLTETLIICFNLFFAIDLFITLRKPFISGAKRQMFYNGASVMITLVLFGLTLLTNTDIINQCTESTEEDNFMSYYFPDFMAYFMGIFVVIAFSIALYSTKKLQEKNNQNNTRGEYIVHHRRILVALACTWLVPCINNNKTFHKYIADTQFAQVLQYISFMLMMLTGAVVNIVRLTQPHVKANFFDILKNMSLKNMLFCWKKKIEEEESQDIVEKKEDRREEKSQAWNIPLSSALSQFSHQSILQNIIQTVLELSQSTSINELSNTFKMDESEADKLLDNMTKEAISEVGRMKKKLELYCVDYGDDIESTRKKTVFRHPSAPSMTNESKASRLPTQSNKTEISVEPEGLKIKATALSYYIFERIRELSNINYAQLQRSLDVAQNYLSIKQTKESLGASGSFFFFSFDKKFVIKTIDEQDVASLIELLPSYYMHLQHEPNSILARIYGLYTIEIASISSITFLLMENAFENFDTLGLKYRQYDMKGSTVSREVANPLAPVLKDVNFLKGDEAFIFMRKDEKHQLRRQIQKDISLLAPLNIMDYSLLLGVADIPENHIAFQSGRYNWKYVSSCRRLSGKLYSLSLIDYLQKFNCQKLTQLKYKTFLSSKTNGVSCVNTKEYFERFLSFMDSIIVVVN